MQIREDDLSGEAVINLLKEHLEHMQAITPVGSVHALDLSGLRAPEVTFWTLWDKDELLGCGALKELGSRVGEIKSMRTASKHQRKGVASTLLEHILAEAESRGFEKVLLETGATEHFAPARALYTKYGFTPCGPFGNYHEDPHSIFMSLTFPSSHWDELEQLRL